MSAPTVLDCCGLTCPQPVIRTKDELTLMAGDTLIVLVDNEAARDNVRRFAVSQGHGVTVREDGARFVLTIERAVSSGGSAEAEPEIICPTSPLAKKIVVHISGEFMGRGDDSLGKRLMVAYFDTLAQFGENLTHITLVNSGVKLGAEGSPVLTEAQELVKLGVEIIACGVCLAHYGLQDRLLVGTASNMYSILAAQKEADLILRP